jgi:hypothetical protein
VLLSERTNQQSTYDFEQWQVPLGLSKTARRTTWQDISHRAYRSGFEHRLQLCEARAMEVETDSALGLTGAYTFGSISNSYAEPKFKQYLP